MTTKASAIPVWPAVLLMVAGILAGAAVPASAQEAASGAKAAHYLYLWTADISKRASDFLIVVDVQPASRTYAQVVASLPVGITGTNPHHTEAELHSSGMLLANGFAAGKTFIFDVNEPLVPKLAGSFEDAAGFSHPHSFLRLDDGGLLVTFQYAQGDHGKPGGLVEFAPDGKLRRASRPADNPVDPDVRPYSPIVLKNLDRVVTTSTDMHGKLTSRAVQIWRFSDLALLHTLRLPEAPGGRGADWTAEPRVLDDGETVMVSTFSCGLYALTGVATPQPEARFVFKFDGNDCGVPMRVGRYWIQTLESAQQLVVLDLADINHPRIASRLKFPGGEVPHWIAYDAIGHRIVVTGDKELSHRAVLVTFDPATGALSWDESFREPGAARRGVNLDRSTWPHGKGGPGKPHGAVFSLR